MRRIETNDWWPQLVDLKDELSLRELAERFDVTPGAVSAALKRNGISRKAAPPGPRSRRRQALPPEPGEASAPRKGKTKRGKAKKGIAKKGGATTIAKKTRGRSKSHLIEPFEGLLGNRPDSEVASKAGVSQRTVANYRTRKGIDGYSGPKRRGKDRKPRRSKIDPFRELLGTVPDRVVAEKAGVSLNAVRNYRVKRGIPARGRGRPPAGSVPPPGQAATMAPTAVSSKGSVAWKIRLASGEVLAVAAPSLSAAAQRAEGIGDVVGMERIGRLV